MNNDLIADIKQQISILAYLEQAGYTPVRHGTRRYRLKEHDSLVFDEQRFWWNSRGVSGSVIDLCMELEGRTQKEALRELAGRLHGRGGTHSPPATARAPARVAPAFALPSIEPRHWGRVKNYLTDTRALHPDVVTWLIDQHLIYPDARGNLCYISTGYRGKPDYAAQKGTNPQKPYRHVVDGSNCAARAAFALVGRRPTELFVFEAAIDAFSMMSLLHTAGLDFTQYGYLSLECCYEGPLAYHLARNPQIKKIWLAQDADAAGEQSRENCFAALKKAGWKGQVNSLYPTQKDWNELLQSNENEGSFMLMNEEQAIRIQCNVLKNTGLVTGRMVLAMIRAALRSRTSTAYGQQSLTKLNRQNRSLEKKELSDKTLRQVQKKLKEYSVDFSILRDKKHGTFEVWFKGQDVHRINEALRDCIAELDKPKPEAAKDLHAACEHAKQAAAEQNAQQAADKPERGVER